MMLPRSYGTQGQLLVPVGHIPTVLIVEDEALIAIELEDIAMAAGYAAVTFPNHAAALEALDANAVDVALLDGTAEGEAEFELARILATRGIPFAFCTGVPRDSLPEEFKDSTVIAKPFLDGDVEAVLRAAKR